VTLDELLRPGSLPRLELLGFSGLLMFASLFSQRFFMSAFEFREMNSCIAECKSE
jgi:hypothetical protein